MHQCVSVGKPKAGNTLGLSAKYTYIQTTWIKKKKKALKCQLKHHARSL